MSGYSRDGGVCEKYIFWGVMYERREGRTFRSENMGSFFSSVFEKLDDRWSDVHIQDGHEWRAYEPRFFGRGAWMIRYIEGKEQT